MTLREILNVTFLFLLYLSLQILLVRNMVLFDVGFCFIYVACILLLPTEMSLSATLLTAFGVGIIVDTFYNTLGMHAAATVLMAYIRPLVIRLQEAQHGFESRFVFSIREMGVRDFLYYVMSLTFIHHFALFLIEANNILLVLPAMVKILASTLFTSFTIVLVQYFSRN
ncbi:hypothetical protein [Larkinella arboricola]|uniref:Rod shape-determining protein MreD n=1 Tax=Larkinella arboricola TaxID=643671 RepID=A0A327WXI8_LARAB|nr:hypothetical protein [Larkinella arboricola]RAJ97863.1 hypothetical protein LX87_02769 [Larkinella arboricola]